MKTFQSESQNLRWSLTSSAPIPIPCTSVHSNLHNNNNNSKFESDDQFDYSKERRLPDEMQSINNNKELDIELNTFHRHEFKPEVNISFVSFY
jgi:hypothetical protein